MDWFLMWLDLFGPVTYGLVICVSVLMAYVAAHPGRKRYLFPIAWAALVFLVALALWALGGQYDHGVGAILTYWTMPVLLGVGPLVGWLRRA